MDIKSKGIDVSEHKGVIDWDAVKASGIVDFAILRCGYGNDEVTDDSTNNTDRFNQDDEQFDRNVSECDRLGMPWGTYLYSYATSLDEADSEYRHIKRMLQGKNPTRPVYIDMEDADGYKAERGVSNQMCCDICKIVIDKLRADGYDARLYANLNWAENILSGYACPAPIWIAQYFRECQYSGNYDMWQYASDGSIPGIKGNVDVNYCYADYAANSAPNDAPTAPSVQEHSHGIGEHIIFSTCYASSTAPISQAIQADDMIRNDGVITDIADGAPNPYLLDGGLCWVNDGDIRGLYGEDAEPQTATYTVQSGDNLSEIAAQFGTDYQSIADKNGIEDPSLIYPGQTLTIPV